MALTLGLTGMDPATEAALKAAFTDANARLGGRWTLEPEADAAHIVVDMDSMYGPMSWLRLHAAGKHVIGLTSAPRTQTDHRLGRPFDHDQVEALLREVAAAEGITLVAGAPAPAAPPVRAPEPAAVEGTAPAVAAAPPVVAPVAATPTSSPSPAPSAAPAIEVAPVAAEDIALAASIEGHDAAVASSREATAQPASAAIAAAASPDVPVAVTPPVIDVVAPAEPPAPRERGLADFLVPGALASRVRFRRAGGPDLLLDPAARVYHGPALLKPTADYFDGTVEADTFEPLPDAEWETAAVAAGEAQPISRLAWYGGLLAGRGVLVAGLDPEGRFRLNKWPQTEREFPRHFRIATAMMKGPATLAEIAEASGLSLADVTDFVNANLATGFAEAVSDAPTTPTEPQKPAGLFGRLRGR